VAAAVLVLGLAGCAPADDEATRAAATPPPTPRVAIETTAGRIVVELDRERAPETVRNFLAHVRSGFYDGLQFHRVLPDFAIQAGLLTESGAQRTTSIFPIPNEATNGLQNVRGAIAMARGGDPHSATSEFFINVRDNPKLDFRDRTAAGFGYAAFGRVIEGLPAVDAIAGVPTRRTGRFEALPTTPVVIRRAYVIEPETDGRRSP
jgi:peptidyl-prolyl cis-trans isomerase B (cyclophilin B)